jgi:beta-galactosidase
MNAAGSHLQVLVMSDDEAGRTWPVTYDGQTFLITGPDYVGDASIGQERVHAVAEYRSLPPADTAIFLPDLTSAKLHVNSVAGDPEAPVLTGWRECRVVEQSPNYDDSAWLQTNDPQQMGTDGDYSAYAWYRVPVNVPDAGTYYLSVSSVRDRMIVFVDGNRLPDQQVQGNTAIMSVGAGAHEIAVLAAHYGRDKFNGYSGPIADHDSKGLSGYCTLSGRPVQNWRMRGGIGDPASLNGWVPVSSAAGNPAFAPAFFQAHFTAPVIAVPGLHPVIRVHLGGMSAGFVWLNGHNLGRYPEKIPVDGLYLPECWIKAGDNTLCIFDEDGRQPTGVKLYVETGASRNVAILSR